MKMFVEYCGMSTELEDHIHDFTALSKQRLNGKDLTKKYKEQVVKIYDINYYCEST